MEKHAAAEASNAVLANNNNSRCRPDRWSSGGGSLVATRTTDRQTSRASSTLLSGNSNNPVVLLAIVELDFAAASHGDCDLVDSKLRIRASEVVDRVPDVADENDGDAFKSRSFHLVYTVRQLKTKIQQNFACIVPEQWEELLDISIFDIVLNTYVPLPPNDDGFNVVKRYGKRWRIRLTERHATNAQTSKHKLLEPPVLAIQGRYFDFDGSLTLTAGNNENHYQLQFNEMHNRPNAGTGFNVWDGALLLARYLADVPKVVQGRRVLELGAGSSGVPGLAAAVLGAQHVTLTDLPEIIPLLQATVNCNMDAVLQANKNDACHCRRNRVHKDEELICCRSCNWYSPPQDLLTKRENGEPPFDVILVADCVWMEHLVAPLFDVLKRLTDETTTMESTISEEEGRDAVKKRAVRNEGHNNLANGEITMRDQFSNHYISTMNVGLLEDDSPDNSWSDIYKVQYDYNRSSRSTSKKSNQEISYSNLHEPPTDNNDFVWPIYQNITDESLSFSECLDFEDDQRDDTGAKLSERHHAKNNNGEQQTLSFQQGDNHRPRVIISYQRRGKATHDAFQRGLHEIFSHVEELEPANFNMPDVFYLLSCQR